MVLKRRSLHLDSSKDNLLVAKMDPSQRRPSMKVTLNILLDKRDLNNPNVSIHDF